MKVSAVSFWFFLVWCVSASALAFPAANGVGIPNPFTNPDMEANEQDLFEIGDAKLEDKDLDFAKRANAAPKTFTTGAELKTLMLKYHNAYRAHHRAGNVTWSKTLAKSALATAMKCVYAHSNPYKYGENLAGGSSGYSNPAYMVYLWYSEVSSYDFSRPAYSDATGHFTQVVWKATTKIGCAWVTGCAGTGSLPNMLWCEYSPNGNLLPDSNFAINVGAPHATPRLPAVPKTTK